MGFLLQRIIGSPLSVLFPVRLPRVELELEQPRPASHDPFASPITECGVIARGYDVRRTGIERVQQEEL